MGPCVVSAVKSGAMSLMRRVGASCAVLAVLMVFLLNKGLLHELGADQNLQVVSIRRGGRAGQTEGTYVHRSFCQNAPRRQHELAPSIRHQRYTRPSGGDIAASNGDLLSRIRFRSVSKVP